MSQELYVSLLKLYQCTLASITVSFVPLIITRMEFSAFFSETRKKNSLIETKKS